MKLRISVGIFMSNPSRLILWQIVLVPVFALVGCMAALDYDVSLWRGAIIGGLAGACFGMVFGTHWKHEIWNWLFERSRALVPNAQPVLADPRFPDRSMTGWEKTAGLLLLLAMPLLMTVLIPDWLYPSAGGIDSWIYLGFFRNYPLYQGTVFPETYYGSRLSWVLPGWCVHQLLPTLLANHVLHLGVYFLAIFSLYDCLCRTVSQRAALVASLALACHPPFLIATGWDYTDGAGIAYYLLTWSLLTRAAGSAWSAGWLCCAGASAAALVYTNITWVILCPPFLVGYPLLRARLRGARILPAVTGQTLFMLAGVLFLSVLLGRLNNLAGGQYYFYGPSYRYATGWGNTPNRWAQPVQNWLGEAYWLIWPTVLALGSAVWLAASWGRRLPGFCEAAGWWPTNHLYALLVMMLIHLRGLPMLQFRWYASYLIGASMLAFGTLLHPALESLPRRTYWTGLVLAMVLSMALLFPSVPRALMLVLLAGSVSVLVLSLCIQGRCALAACLVLICTATHCLPISVDDNGSFARITSAADFIDRLSEESHLDYIHGARPRFWYDTHEKPADEYLSLSSIWLAGFSLINDQFPSSEILKDDLPRPGDLIVIPSQQDRIVEKAEVALREHGLEVRRIASQDIGNGEEGYTVTILAVTSRPDPSP